MLGEPVLQTDEDHAGNDIAAIAQLRNNAMI
jgi:hypothetical protein